jgi:hypothetical protein
VNRQSTRSRPGRISPARGSPRRLNVTVTRGSGPVCPVRVGGVIALACHLAAFRLLPDHPAVHRDRAAVAVAVRLNDHSIPRLAFRLDLCAVGELAVGDESRDLAHALIIEGAIMEELIRRLDKQVNEIQLQLVTIRDLRSKLLETADEINGRRLGY